MSLENSDQGGDAWFKSSLENNCEQVREKKSVYVGLMNLEKLHDRVMGELLCQVLRMHAGHVNY